MCFLTLNSLTRHRQALEKNQQWLAYDQQREAYVQSVVGRTLELEQQLAQVKQQHAQQEATSGGELQGVHKLISCVSSVSAIRNGARGNSSHLSYSEWLKCFFSLREGWKTFFFTFGGKKKKHLKGIQD